jgi:hypothetical protein
MVGPDEVVDQGVDGLHGVAVGALEEADPGPLVEAALAADGRRDARQLERHGLVVLGDAVVGLGDLAHHAAGARGEPLREVTAAGAAQGGEKLPERGLVVRRRGWRLDDL